jgi:hypothetical protein
MPRSDTYPDTPRFIGVVAGFLTFALLERVTRGLARRFGSPEVRHGPDSAATPPPRAAPTEDAAHGTPRSHTSEPLKK